MRTVDDVIAGLPTPASPRLPAPRYEPKETIRSLDVGLCVPSMKSHMTDEGWQLFDGLNRGADTWWLEGFGLEFWTTRGFSFGLTDVGEILNQYSPRAVLIQDKKEWEGLTAGKMFDPRETFRNVGALRARPDVFKLTVLKDAHQRPEYHRQAADEMDANAWVTYYHPRIVKHLAPYVREEHLVRTYHSVDSDRVPASDKYERFNRALLSGAVSGAYPLRSRLLKDALSGRLPEVTPLPHPGYHRNGSVTNQYLDTLSRYKVAICTSSMYGYSVRKLVEGTACGCRVITDLPVDDVLPEIDGNMYRIRPDCPTSEVNRLVSDLCDTYSPADQERWAGKAKTWYDFRASGRRLAADVEALRRTYRGEE